MDTLPAAAAPQAQQQRPNKRVRASTACTACRNRRRKCDNQRPACGHCLQHSLECAYQDAAPASAAAAAFGGDCSRLELQLVAMSKKLDDIMAACRPPASTPTLTLLSSGPARLNADQHQYHTYSASPFQLLSSARMMVVLGLQPEFAQQLLQLERNGPSSCVASGSNCNCLSSAPRLRLRLISEQQAIDALSSFSLHVHPCYPILPLTFTDTYFRALFGTPAPASESCSALLVATIGLLIRRDCVVGVEPDADTATCSRHAGAQFADAAMAFLPAVIADASITGVQCLLLWALYHCCILEPCKAYDYVTIASIKVRNLVKVNAGGPEDHHDDVKRAFWAVLLLESELRVQYDLVESGIWADEHRVALPAGLGLWRFDDPLASNTATYMDLASDASTAHHDPDMTKDTLSYFLAEIAMRRMLQRCNTAIHYTTEGHVVYAPGIAQELEFQLDEWYRYLPPSIRFHQEAEAVDTPRSSIASPHVSSLCNFLRVQYHCCKLSIYWPAAYQHMQLEKADVELSNHSLRFIHAYCNLVPSILTAVHDCIVHRWTLYASIFMTTMATIQAARTLCVKNEGLVDWHRLTDLFKSTGTVDARIIKASPTLSQLSDALARRIETVCSSVAADD